MASSNSSECASCVKKKASLEQQKETIRMMESRMRDLIKAYKSVSHERDAVLATSSIMTNVSSSGSEEYQERVSVLEASVAELSVMCGKYERERIKDQAIIDELINKRDGLEIELSIFREKGERVVKDKKEDDTARRIKHKHKAVQTENYESEVEEVLEVKKKEIVSMMNTMTQTEQDYLPHFEMNNGSPLESYNHHNGHKSDLSHLAIVVPTQREEATPTPTLNAIDSPILLASPSPPRTPSPTLNPFPFPIMNSQPSTSTSGRRNPTTNSNIDITNDSFLPVNSSQSGISLFYVNELARKEIDLAEARLQVKEYECAMREVKWNYNVDKFRLQSRITELERQQSQLISQQPSSQLNMTYIRNVLIRLLNTKDKQQRQFMINALLAALDSKDIKIDCV